MQLAWAQSKKNSYIWCILGAGSFIYLIIMFFVFNISFETVVKFILLNVVSIFLPGLAILFLIKIRLSRVGKFCISYILGYAFIVLEYFLAEVFNRTIPFLVITLFFAIVSGGIIVWQIKKDRNILECRESDSEIVNLIFLAIFMLFNILAYAANYLGTDVVTVFRAERDLQYWTNNTVALKIAWPADNLFMAGNSLNYHYFSNIPIAFLCEAFKIDVFTMSFPLYAMTKTIVMVGAAHFLLDSVTSGRKKTAVGYILILCTAGIEFVSYATFISHTLLHTIGFDMGYAYGMIFFAFLVRQWKKERFDIGLFIGTILNWSMCVGTKAPVASILILFAALLCFYWLIRRQWKLSLGYGLSVLTIFLVICKYCVGMFSVLSGDSPWSVKLYSLSDFIVFARPKPWDIGACIIAKMGSFNPTFGAIAKCISLNPTMVLGTIVSIIIILVWKKQKKIAWNDFYLYMSLWFTSLLGLVLGVVVNADGHSEIYFSMTALIPMAAIVLLTWGGYNAASFPEKKIILVMQRCLSVFFVALFVMGVYRFAWSSLYSEGAVKNSIRGLKNIYYSMKDYDYSDQIASGIRNTDVDALNWIRDNAAGDALIMTDRAIMTDNEGYYMYGIFCERQQYLEGTNMLKLAGDAVQNEISRRKDIIRAVYNNIDGALQNAKEEGIDYVVQTVDITPDFVYDESKLDLVKSTATMNVYRVK